MGISTLLIDTGIQVLGGLGKSCLNRFLNALRDFPQDPAEGKQRAQNAKVSTENSIKKLEDELDEILKILTREAKIDTLRKIGNLKNKLTAIRGVIESKSGTTMEAGLKIQDVLKAYTTVFLTLVYDGMVIETIVEQMAERIYDDDYELDDLIKKLRSSIQNLDNSWGFYSKVTADPNIAKAIHSKMKETRGQLINFMDELDNLNSNQMDNLVSGVVIKKPKVFGKKKYVESLAAMIYNHGKEIGIPKVSIPDIFEKIAKSNPNAQFSDEDIEQAVNSLIESNRAYALTIEENVKMVEFKKSDESLVCGNCGVSGGIFRNYKHCLVKDKYVCEDCISFWGKCKICGNRIKSGKHPDRR